MRLVQGWGFAVPPAPSGAHALPSPPSAALAAHVPPSVTSALATWIAAIPSALVLLAGLALAAAAVAAGEWGLWRLARRAGLPVAPSGSLLHWIAGLGDLPHAGQARGEPQAAAFGFATMVAAVVLAAGLVGRAAAGDRFPAGPGVVALFPLACALGYAVAAERALTSEAARHRVRVASRILLSTPAWVVAVALWARWGGAPGDPLWRAALAVALVWSGLFILPGAVAQAGPAGEGGPTARPWGGDASEESQAVRLLTGAAHYAALAAVCYLAGGALAGVALGGAALGGTVMGGAALGRGTPAGLALGVALAAVLALALRVGATLPRVGAWVRGGPAWMVPALVLLSAVARGAR